MGVTSTVIDYFFSFIFLISFYFKARNMFNFSYEIRSYNVVPPSMAKLSAAAVVTLEFLLAIFYAFHVLHVYKEGITIGLFLFFTIVTYRKKREKGEESCNCFGKVRFLNKNPIVRNISFIVLSIIQLWLSNPQRDTSQSIYLLLAFSICIVIFDIWDNLNKLKKLRPVI
ncbi:MauE/DoxX family redox-associated membrane protein [Paenibacillus sp. FSL K6-2862]|uniref:MauE/DoxX family redox-associated membrane protein n=1 Tax=Paenibacillus sp. FSL K6-2862 TaxID=2921484 RepID=UPI0030F76141